MVEQSAVNRRVTSSNLVSGARYEKPAIPKREAGFLIWGQGRTRWIRRFKTSGFPASNLYLKIFLRVAVSSSFLHGRLIVWVQQTLEKP
jgi:hypothetical protein